MSNIVTTEPVRELSPREELILSTKELDKIMRRIEKLNGEVEQLQVLAFEKQEEIQNISTRLV